MDIVKDLDSTTPGGDNDLHNPKPPTFVIQSEKAEHRLLIALKMQGYSNREIARTSGYSEAWLSQFFRQDWVRKRIADDVTQSGLQALEKLIESVAVDSIFTLVDLRDNAPPAVRRQAADSLLDRYLGKPTQKVITNNVNVNVDALDDEIERIENELCHYQATPEKQSEQKCENSQKES